MRLSFEYRAKVLNLGEKVAELVVKTFPRHPSSTEVVVEVKCCGLNFFDNYIRLGLSQDVKLPCILGLECAGIIVAVGDRISNLHENEKVIVHCPDGGALSQYITVNQTQILQIPCEVDFSKAASLTVNYLTALFTLRDLGGIKDGCSVFIQGAAGGVGWAATQIARLYKNVTIFGTASVHKHESIKLNGVHYPLSYDQNINQLIREVCPEGVSIVLENMAGENFSQCQNYLQPMGKIIVIGAKNMVAGERFSWISTLRTWWNTKNVSVEDLIINNKSIAGFHLNELLKKSPETFLSGWKEILSLYLEKKIDPKIDSEFSIYEVKNGLQKLIDRMNIGKVVIRL